MTTAEIYQRLRPLMFSIAYRMLGSVSEAEDVAQEAFLRYHTMQGRAEIDSPKAYLSAVTTRLCIDHLRSARTRREAYVGEWLPEPLLTGEAADPPGRAEQADSLSMAFLLVLERLSPVERAVFRCTTSSATATRRSRASSARARTTAASWHCVPGAT